ncbi:unnamed protein product [Closterium sp. NIES-53]
MPMFAAGQWPCFLHPLHSQSHVSSCTFSHHSRPSHVLLLNSFSPFRTHHSYLPLTTAHPNPPCAPTSPASPGGSPSAPARAAGGASLRGTLRGVKQAARAAGGAVAGRGGQGRGGQGRGGHKAQRLPALGVRRRGALKGGVGLGHGGRGSGVGLMMIGMRGRGRGGGRGRGRGQGRGTACGAATANAGGAGGGADEASTARAAAEPHALSQQPSQQQQQ